MGYYYNWFDWNGFRTAYLNNSTYKNKESLISDFHHVFYNITECSLSKWGVYENVVEHWKDSKKRLQIRAQLEGMGYSKSAITGIFKQFERTLTYSI